VVKRIRWFIGVIIMVATIPLCRLATALGYRDFAVRHWCRLGLWTLGVHARCAGALPTGASVGGGALIVANHNSYMDILILGACAPGSFLAKGEIARWPVIGFAARAGGVLFVERDSPRASHRLIGVGGQALSGGNRILICLEGGILSNRDDHGPAPFRPMFFQACVETGCPVIPVGIKHIEPADQTVWTWGEGVGLYEHMTTKVLAADRMEVEVHFATPLYAGEGVGRKELAQRSREEVTRLIT
jgi:1-acyl-sn-glycerol-3-phosphate acyltransferase